MRHTHEAWLRAWKEAAESGDILQTQNPGPNSSWDDYLEWSQPRLAYEDSFAWYPSEGAVTDQSQFYNDTQCLIANSINDIPESRSDKTSKSNFCGLQPWYFKVMQDFSPISPPATILPQLVGGKAISYESSSLDEESQLADQRYENESCSPKTSRQLCSVSDDGYPRTPSDGASIDLTEELDDHPSPSEDEKDRCKIARVNANKKRKIAHSVIEKKYRSRINDSMAELRHCIPSTAKGGASLDSKRSFSEQGPDDVIQNRSSGKVATLLDAVHYIQELELENEAFHGKIDVIQRQNKTLQKIALYKINTNALPIIMDDMDIDEECAEQDMEGGDNEQASNRRKNNPLDRVCCNESKGSGVAQGGSESLQKDVVRTKAVTHAPRLDKRYGSTTKSLNGKLAAIKISED